LPEIAAYMRDSHFSIALPSATMPYPSKIRISTMLRSKRYPLHFHISASPGPFSGPHASRDPDQGKGSQEDCSVQAEHRIVNARGN